ncbi:MAG: hypothetical protein ACKVQU_22265 [Burkholderiales bacterium]
MTTSNNVSWTREDCIARATKLIPALRERAQASNEAMCQPEKTIQDYWDANLWYMLKPRKFGGPELSPDCMYDVAAELARGDGSAAWIFSLMSIHDLFMAYYPLEAQEEYWSKPTLSSSSFTPGGKATVESGGFRVSGRWMFSSGIDHADWVLLGAVCGMISTDPPIPDMRFFMFPRTDVKIINDWQVMGLRGTGSKSCTVEDVFVPAHRVLALAAISEGTSPGSLIHSSPLYRAPVWSIFPFSISASASGIARGAFDTFIDEMKSRETHFDHTPMARKAPTAMRVSEAGALVDASNLLYNRSLRETMQKIYAGETLSIQHRLRSRRDQAYSVHMAKNAAEILMNGQGGKGLHESNPVQRAFRDLEAIKAHIVGNWDMPALNYGTVMLGGQPTDFFF